MIITEKKYREKEWQMMKYKTLAEIPGTIVYDYEPDMDKLTLEITEEDGNTKTIVAEKFLENMEHHPWLADEGIRQQKKDIRSVMSGPMTKISEFKGRFTEDSEFKWYRSHFRSLADEDGKVYRIVGRAECEENKA